MVEQAGQQDLVKFYPTPVVFVRSLPSDSTEGDLRRIFSQFGEVVKVLMLIHKDQAFVEFSVSDQYLIPQTTEAAQSCLLNSQDLYLNNKKLGLEFSGRSHIKDTKSEQTQPNHVLLISVTNLKFPVNVDVLYSVFNKYGSVLRIVIFARVQGVQALIEMESLKEAVAAKSQLDGKPIYSASNFIKIEFSNLKKLEISENNDRARDFTLENEQEKEDISDVLTKDEYLKIFKQQMNLLKDQPKPTLPQPYFKPASLSQVTQVKVSMPIVAQIAALPPQMPVPAQMPSQMPSQQNNSSQQIQPTHPIYSTSVLIISNLPDKTTPYSLFKLFSHYGNVARIKILIKNRSNALIQFLSGQEAALAKFYLHGVPFFQANLNVNNSTTQQILMPGTHEAQEIQWLTQDYSLSKEQRYKVAGSKNFNHVCPPSAVLHMSNLLTDVGEDWYRSLFSQVAVPKKFKFFEKDGKLMGFTIFQSVRDAVRIVIIYHNYSVNGKHLKLSFSKAII